MWSAAIKKIASANKLNPPMAAKIFVFFIIRMLEWLNLLSNYLRRKYVYGFV
jgi:hypothetical protein